MFDDAPYLLDVSRLIWRRWVGRQPTGIDRVCLAYLRHFGPRSQAVVQHRGIRRILGRESSNQLFAMLREPGERFKAQLVTGGLRNLLHFRGKGRGRPYLNVGHTGLNSEAFRAWVGRSDVRPIYLVHDLIPITHPQFCRSGEDDRHRERMRTVLETAAGVIGNSRATLDDLAQFATDEERPMPAAIAAWLGIEEVAPPAVSQPPRPTFVTLGTIEGRKNHAMLLDVWARLIERLGESAPRLLIIGQRGWEAGPVFDVLDRNNRIRRHIVELNRCSDEELSAHLGAATALLFPSFAEGYGLPLIEALARGVPVIASDLPIFHEIDGDIPTYIDASDRAGWEHAIVDFARPDSAARNLQLQRMAHFAAPTWAAHFAAVEGWLATIL